MNYYLWNNAIVAGLFLGLNIPSEYVFLGLWSLPLCFYEASRSAWSDEFRWRSLVASASAFVFSAVVLCTCLVIAVVLYDP